MRDRRTLPSKTRPLLVRPALLRSGAEVAGVLDELAPALVAAGAIVELAPLPPVVADPVAMRAAVRAVLLQALACAGGMRPRIRVTAGRHEGALLLSVADNGLPPHARSAAQPSGAVAAAVARLGGVLWTDARPDGGAIVRFTVPAPA